MDNRKNNTKSHRQAIMLFISRILDDPAWPKLLRTLPGYDARAVAKRPPREISNSREKANVKIEFDTNHRPIRVRIMTFGGKSAGNHLERCRHWEFCSRNDLLGDHEFLKGMWLRKAANSKGRLVNGQDEFQRVSRLFAPIAPWITALRGTRNYPQVLALYNSTEDYWHLYDMELALVRKQRVALTPRGNILIGKYIVIQRRGKEGEKGTSSTNIDHPSNDVQMKMKVYEFYHEVKPTVKTDLVARR